MSKIYKSGSMDKYDGYMPNKAHWIHDDYYVSNEQREFHTAAGWAYREGRRHGFRIGVNNKMWKVSPMGINVDNRYIGKSDNL